MKNFIKSVLKHLKIQIYRPTEVDKYRKQGVTIGKNCNLYSVFITIEQPKLIRNIRV